MRRETACDEVGKNSECVVALVLHHSCMHTSRRRLATVEKQPQTPPPPPPPPPQQPKCRHSIATALTCMMRRYYSQCSFIHRSYLTPPPSFLGMQSIFERPFQTPPAGCMLVLAEPLALQHKTRRTNQVFRGKVGTDCKQGFAASLDRTDLSD